jgi:hypothetical protein
VESMLTVQMRARVEVLFLSHGAVWAWLEAGTLRTRPVKLDCVHDDHDQGHDEGDGVEVEWD